MFPAAALSAVPALVVQTSTSTPGSTDTTQTEQAVTSLIIVLLVVAGLLTVLTIWYGFQTSPRRAQRAQQARASASRPRRQAAAGPRGRQATVDVRTEAWLPPATPVGSGHGAEMYPPEQGHRPVQSPQPAVAAENYPPPQVDAGRSAPVPARPGAVAPGWDPPVARTRR